MPFVRTIASHVTMPSLEQADYKLQSLTPQFPYDYNEERTRNLIDRNSATINRNSISKYRLS